MRIAPIGRAWQLLANVELESLGVSESEGRALVYLESGEPGMRQGDLARITGVTEASIARTVKHLEAAGLVERVADEHDGRARQLSLTAEGLELAQRLDARLARLRAELLEGLPSEALKGMIAVFDQFSARISERREQV
ncbi:MarR family winged helix-turn-helix transcriptional regulator [Novosphingobium sp. 9]|uniref:MarR family winged helix-turn-helix transcriptional regulator n=1 Tax=Novosphingobium sp. 9 TaxID=2025349 RepID=UPI0021B63DE1|nr:MarR family transcriptional regulator [Novosphingobium sp. 9]